MNRLALLALLALCACGQPDRFVIDDDPELVDATMTALTDLEIEAGCKLFRRVDIGGRSKDWRGNLPPFGTVTVGVAPGRIHDGYDSRCAHPSCRRRHHIHPTSLQREIAAAGRRARLNTRVTRPQGRQHHYDLRPRLNRGGLGVRSPLASVRIRQQASAAQFGEDGANSGGIVTMWQDYAVYLRR